MRALAMYNRDYSTVHGRRVQHRDHLEQQITRLQSGHLELTFIVLQGAELVQAVS